MDSHVSHVPLSSCMWGLAGCPVQSGESTPGKGPAPHKVPSSWHTAGHSRSALSHLHWFLSLGHLRTDLPRSGLLYLHREKSMMGVRKRVTAQCLFSCKKGWGCRLCFRCSIYQRVSVGVLRVECVERGFGAFVVLMHLEDFAQALMSENMQ